MAIFGVDVGEKRVGVAKVDPETKVVVPVGVFLVNDISDTTSVVDLLKTPDEDTLVVVGMPMNQRGELTEQSRRVQEFVQKLRGMLPETVKIVFFGESGTTKLAIERLRERGFDDVKIREARASGAVDVEAACIILEGWVEENL
ncbi:Holliday junction resolvase RuvX [Candidatus Saccharibacteria bacterium]|nr:Holliday junction resolvase RuvX [Candidatus Saccharibacteria bacterium]